ncbi:hypothetical protein KXD40_003662 [Peronospora effusa]|nr:hypothetical protein KXD40_003662 [Peronospora effusa]
MNPQHYATYDHLQQQQQQVYAQENMRASTRQSGINTPVNDSIIPPLDRWTPPSHQELQLYDQLFTYTADQHRNRIGGHQAVAFFMRSHLDKTVLREVKLRVKKNQEGGLTRIWTIADRHQTSNLSRHEFYVAMRLISMAQHGEHVSVSRFYQLAALSYPLAKIEGVSCSHEMDPTLIQMPSQTQDMSVSSQVHTQQDVNAVQHQKPLSYALSAAEKSKYELVFHQYDTDHDGFLMGTEAIALFQMSGLGRNILREIWSMADVTQDSKLNIQEFYVAMHLIVCLSKRGLPMPPTLPRELGEAAFGASGTGPVVSGFGSRVTESPSQNGLVRQPQESVPLPEPEGMSAFDALSTTDDAPILSLQSSTPRSLREDSFNPTDDHTRNSQLRGSNEPSVVIPTDSDKPHGSNSFPRSRITSAVGRDRTNSASSLSSMSSVGGLTPLPSQQSTHQLPPRNVGSNERVLKQADNLGFQACPALGGMGFGELQPPVTSLEKPFMSDEEDKKLVSKLDQQNEEVTQALASVERKQSTIEMVSNKLRDLDELRQELVTLVMKRENMRVASACKSESRDTFAEEQTRQAVERSLRSLLENQKRLVHQLQHDISRYEGELEEAILNAKLQHKLSLGSRSPLIDAATTPLSGHDSSRGAGGGTTACTGNPLVLDGSNTLPSSAAVPNSPSISAFSPDATDSSGFNAFSNFDSAPRSLASATPSPAAGSAQIPSGSLFSPTPSPSQSASENDTFDVFGGFAAPTSTGVVPSVLSDVGSTPGKLPISPSSSPAAVNDSVDFGDFNAARPLAAADAGVSPSPPAAPYTTSPISPSSVPAAVDDGGLSGFGDFKSGFSSLPAAVDDDELSGFGDFEAVPFMPAAVAASSSTDFSWEPTPSNIAAPVTSSTPGHESLPLSAASEMPVFDAFATAPFLSDDTTTSGSTTVATEILILSPVAADNDELNAFDDFSVAAVSTANAVKSCELVSKQESTEDLLFSPTPSPVAATETTNFDMFGDFSAPPTSSGSAVSVHASEKVTGNSPFSSVAADGDDFDNFGDFNAAPASADSTAPLPAKASSNSPFSSVAEDETAFGFGGFNAAPASTDAVATPFEPLETKDSNGSLSSFPLVADSCEFRDVCDPFNSVFVTVDSTKSAEVSGNSASSPVSGGFEVIGDSIAAVTSVDSVKSAAKEDTSDINDSLKVLEDLSAAPSSNDFDSS